MHVFAKKPTAPQQTTTAKPTIFGRGHLGQCPERQAVLQRLQAEAKEPDADFIGQAPPRVTYDFSQIPLHPSEAGVRQRKLVINQLGDAYEKKANRVTVQANGRGPVAAPPIVHEAGRSPSQPVGPASRASYGATFCHDFSQMRVHSSQMAEPSGWKGSAHAYTVGSPALLQRQAPEWDELRPGQFAGLAEPIQLRANFTQHENRTGLPDRLKAGIESLSGLSMGDVRVHYNSSQPAQLNALAYTQGTDIHVAPGQEQHLPHEAWHVVQQAQRRVQPTMQLKDGISLNNDDGLEHEASRMGARAMQMAADRGTHETGCCCGNCGGRQQVFHHKPLEPLPVLKASVQRCVNCGNNNCTRGEICGYDQTWGGLFSSGSGPAVLPYNSSNAKKQSGKAMGTELEHVIPGQALRLVNDHLKVPPVRSRQIPPSG